MAYLIVNVANSPEGRFRLVAKHGENDVRLLKFDSSSRMWRCHFFELPRHECVVKVFWEDGGVTAIVDAPGWTSRAEVVHHGVKVFSLPQMVLWTKEQMERTPLVLAEMNRLRE